MNTLPLLTLYSKGILSLLRHLHALIEIFIKDFYFGKIWSKILVLEWLFLRMAILLARQLTVNLKLTN